MAAQTKLEEVIGYIMPMQDGTRLRKLPQTYSTVLISNCRKGWVVDIDLTILYLEADPVQTAIWKNDLWGRVIKINGTPIEEMVDDLGQPIVSPVYMAIDYHNGPVCTKHYIPAIPVPPDPIPSGRVQALKVVEVIDGIDQPMRIFKPEVPL